MLYRRENNRQTKEFDDATSYNVSHLTDEFDFKSANETAYINDMSGLSSHNASSKESAKHGNYSVIKS